MSTRTGALYLGTRLDASSNPTTERLELHGDDLTTHGVIVGMTGSGKTGLGVVLLEEVLASGVPALILDPKGDMGNLLLNFPDFRPDDFALWIDEAEARRKGISSTELAARTASTWRDGLAASGVEPPRMRALREGIDMRVITPGSSAGVPLNLIGDLTPPESSWDDSSETIRDEIEGLVSGLLVLAGIQGDPLTSREHILLSNLVEHAWREGRALDLATLLFQVQDPPMRRLGVFELETFYPAKDRTALAMRLNGLIASPSFAEWMKGEPLDAESLLRAPDGRPRASIVYLAHLSDSERLFVVTLLLSKLVTWMRGQPGTSELRALVYADEVMGFVPPTGEPPTKKPILTLYKQARAHGVGVVMATQNPVDLDYKLMSNAGTWMIGRLQTERDKARIVEALKSAAAGADAAGWDARIGALGKRQFLLKSAGTPEPTPFTTRWAMSYLRGPLTRADLLRLEQPAEPPAATVRRAAAPSASPELGIDESSAQPRVADGVAVRYLDPATHWGADVGVRSGGRRLAPGLAVTVRMVFDERDLRHEEEWEAVFFPLGERFDPSEAVAVDHDRRDFRTGPAGDVVYALGDAPIDRADFFRDAERAIEEQLFRERNLTLICNDVLKLCSRPGEGADDFAARCLAAAEDRADEDAEKLRGRFESRLETARRRAAEAERRVRELDVDVGQRRQQELVAGAGEVLSMFLGGRRRVRSLSGLSSRRGQTVRTQERLRSASDKLEEFQDAIVELERECEDEIGAIWDRWKTAAEDTRELEVPLERADVALTDLILFWAPTD